MNGTEIVETTDQIHTCLDGLKLAGQGTTAPDEAGQSLAEGSRVPLAAPLNEGGVDLVPCFWLAISSRVTSSAQPCAMRRSMVSVSWTRRLMTCTIATSSQMYRR